MAATADARKTPAYRLHKPTDRAVVTLTGEHVYLGRYGTPDSRAAYYRELAAWETRGRAKRPKVDGLTVRALCDAYLVFAASYFLKGGRPTSRISVLRAGLGALCDLHGDAPAAIGPAQLQVIHTHLVSQGLSRRSVNEHIYAIKCCYRWASARELVPSPTWYGLSCLRGLERGRSAARETSPRRPVPQCDLDLVLAVLDAAGPREGGPAVAAMMRVQLYSGMRPGEVRTMRPRDLDRSGAI